MLKRLTNKYYQRLRILVYSYLSEKVSVKGKVIKSQPVLMIGKGSIVFGDKVRLGFFPSPFFYNGVVYLEARSETSEIIFGNNVYANNNLSIICERSKIEIGDNVLIGTNVEIIDSDFHESHPDHRNSGNHECKPVSIGNNVFLGSNVRILKGVSIGNNSIVANNATVIRDVPSNVIVGGNPAIFIKNIEV